MLTDATVVCIYIYEESLITSATFYAALLMSVVKRLVKKNKMSTGPMPWTSKRTYSINKNSNTSELIRNQMRLFDWKKNKTSVARVIRLFIFYKVWIWLSW